MLGLDASCGMVGCLHSVGVVHIFRWVVCPGQVAADGLKTSLDAYTFRILEEWVPADGYCADIAGRPLSVQPDVWTDGSQVRDAVTGACFGGALFMLGFLVRRGFGGLGVTWICSRLIIDSCAGCCPLSCSVPRPFTISS